MFACDTSDNPILRVLWNKKDTNYISAFSLEDNSIITVDLRRKSDRAAYFSGHQSYVSSLCWSPYSPYSMYSCDVKGNVHLPQYYFTVQCLSWSINGGEHEQPQSYTSNPCFTNIANIHSVHPHPRESVAAVITGNKVMIEPVQQN